MLDIIYEDKYLIVVNKPAKLLTISNAKEKEKTLYHLVSLYLKKKNNKNKIFIVHRLDFDTSGLVLFAKTEAVKEKLQANWNEVQRKYMAVLSGKLIKREGVALEDKIMRSVGFSQSSSHNFRNLARPDREMRFCSR